MSRSDSVPAPMVQVSADTVEKVRETLDVWAKHRRYGYDPANMEHEITLDARWMDNLAMALNRLSRLPLDAATPAASVPAADILALADRWEHPSALRAALAPTVANTRWSDAQELRTLVAAAEQADKGEAADTPHEGSDCVRCGKGPVSTGLGRPWCTFCGSEQDAATAAAVVRVPVNDEAEAEEAAWHEWNRWGESVTQTPMIREAHRAGFRAAATGREQR